MNGSKCEKLTLLLSQNKNPLAILFWVQYCGELRHFNQISREPNLYLGELCVWVETRQDNTDREPPGSDEMRSHYFYWLVAGHLWRIR